MDPTPNHPPHGSTQARAAERPGDWGGASEGLDTLRMAVIVAVVGAIGLRAGSGGKVTVILQFVVTMLVGFFKVAALGKWRRLPRASGAAAAATVSWVGALVGLVMGVVTAAFVIAALNDAGEYGVPDVQGLGTLAILSGLASLLEISGFLVSALRVARHLRAPGAAKLAIVLLALGSGAVVVGVLAAQGVLDKALDQGGQGAIIGTLLAFAALALAALVLFFVLLSALQRAIAARPSEADAF